jgi:alpha-galactosidase
MLTFRQATLSANAEHFTLQPGRANSFEALYVDFQQNSEQGGERFSIFLHPKKDLQVQRLELQFDCALPPEAQFFANGYQSWSESRLLPVTGAIPRLRRIARRHMGLYGDEHIAGIPRGRGRLHAWTYTYLKVAGRPEITLLGSLNERTGFTIFLYDHARRTLTVRKDLDDLQLSHSFPALDFWVGQGAEREVFDAWFRAAEIAPPTASPALGWTSWYRHFTHISEEILLKNLDSFAAQCPSGGYFQIDDGWQTQVGDWHSVKPSFPNGMGNLAARIRAKGLQPGLWLAPFVAAAQSDLVKKHPDWLLKDAKGRPLKVGWNPMWGGWYYALDFYHEGVRAYLSGVFHVVLDKWGFGLLKLDFLFAACLAPPPGKTRGGVMWEVMEFLRHQVGTRRMLVCGVPLGACFGVADFCRIGGDIHLAWRHRLLAFLRHRERVDSLASLRSTLGRWQLNGRAFLNDPDVFILRADHQSLSPAQQHTILIVNVLLGGLLFHSDDVADYSAEQLAELDAALAWRGSRVRGVFEWEKDLFRVDFEKEGEAFSAFCNLNGRARHFPTGQKENGNLELLPFESLILGA